MTPRTGDRNKAKGRRNLKEKKSKRKSKKRSKRKSRRRRTEMLS